MSAVLVHVTFSFIIKLGALLRGSNNWIEAILGLILQNFTRVYGWQDLALNLLRQIGPIPAPV